jgi:hypothetical protein
MYIHTCIVLQWDIIQHIEHWTLCWNYFKCTKKLYILKSEIFWGHVGVQIVLGFYLFICQEMLLLILYLLSFFLVIPGFELRSSCLLGSFYCLSHSAIPSVITVVSNGGVFIIIIYSVLLFICLFFEMESLHIVQASFKFRILLPQVAPQHPDLPS